MASKPRTIKKAKKHFKTLKCAPKQKDKVTKNLKGKSCYSNDDLFLMKKLWNDNNSKKMETNEPGEIWEFLKSNLDNKCYNELCWLKNRPFSSKMNKEVMMKNVFRPFSPDSWKSKPYEWLSSVEILEVMKQYEKKYKEFVFIGPSPIDFDDKKLFGTCVWEKLCKFDLKNYVKTKPKIGIIFNLDPHDKGGSHWVSLFIDINKEFIFYFDSNGDKIPREIKKFAERVISQAANLNINLKYDTNEGKVHQMRDGQCAIFCLYFIIELLKGTKTPAFFKNNRVPDTKMKDYRKKYFNEK